MNKHLLIGLGIGVLLGYYFQVKLASILPFIGSGVSGQPAVVQS